MNAHAPVTSGIDNPHRNGHLERMWRESWEPLSRMHALDHPKFRADLDSYRSTFRERYLVSISVGFRSTDIARLGLADPRRTDEEFATYLQRSLARRNGKRTSTFIDNRKDYTTR